jgi:hypothetical protein
MPIFILISEKMRRTHLLVFSLFFLVSVYGWSTHIVGGEFEMQHVLGYNYKINMIMYFDDINGLPGAEDPEIIAAIYRKRDNGFVRQVFLQNMGSTQVPYTNVACTKGFIKTRRIFYSTTTFLNPAQFDDPEGYYIVYERCCRNNFITNIQEPDATGQTFYLQFPAIVKNGEPFVNSSPQLFPPLSDYGCPGQLYYVDFAGTDPDGDSLVYTLAHPIRGTSTTTAPRPTPPRPLPYPMVLFQPGIGVNNMIPGSPSLSISSEGLITVRPQNPGLYVFSIKCEEFRDGVKIGEVIRDFQMFVLADCPPPGNAPVIEAKKKGVGAFSATNLSLSFANTVADDDRCVEIKISDPDSFLKGSETVSFRLRAVNFKADLSTLLPTPRQRTLLGNDAFITQVCFDECPYTQGGPFLIDIIAMDRTCPLPLMDTVRVAVSIEPPANNAPYFVAPKRVQAALEEGDSQEWLVTARDEDGDPVNIQLVVEEGYNLEDFGIRYEVVSAEPGQTIAKVSWETLCEVYFFGERTHFPFYLLVTEVDKCGNVIIDRFDFDLTVLLPPNNPPVISTDLPGDPLAVVRKIEQQLTFNVMGTDPDGDAIDLRMEGVGFDATALGASFPFASGMGSVTSLFTWDLTCLVPLATRSEYEFRFIVIDDKNKCRIYKADTLLVRAQVLSPDNSPPVPLVLSLNEKPLTMGRVEAFIGEEILLSVTGNDTPSQDLVTVELARTEGNPSGFSFGTIQARTVATSVFRWVPECALLDRNETEKLFTFTFRVYDDKCFNPGLQETTVEVLLKDIESEYMGYVPPNFVSANGDGQNDYFAWEYFDPELGEVVSRLPQDNCQGRFLDVQIFNRWGRPVYSSQSRDFRWYPADMASGVYFYLLRYTDREYRGSVTVRY